MIKKIFWILVVFLLLLSLIVIYMTLEKQKKGSIIGTKFSDIIKDNRDRLDEMCEYTIKTDIELFKKNFPAEVEILFRDFHEKGLSRVAIDEEKNDKMRMIFYKKDGFYCCVDMNAYLIIFSMYSELEAWPYQAYMSDPEVMERLHRNINQNRRFDYMVGENPKLSDEILKNIKDLKITKGDFLKIYSVAMIHYSLLNIYVHKMNAIMKDPNNNVRVLNMFVDDDLNNFLSQRDMWPMAFTGYEHEMREKKNRTITILEIVFSVIIIFLIIFIVNEVRKEAFCSVVDAVLLNNGLSLDWRRKIILKNWPLFFYQPPVEKIKKIIFSNIQEIEIGLIKREVASIFSSLAQEDMDQETKKSVSGILEKIKNGNCSMEQSKELLQTVKDMIFAANNRIGAPSRIIEILPPKKQGRGESKRSILLKDVAKINYFMGLSLDDLSMKQLTNLYSVLSLFKRDEIKKSFSEIRTLLANEEFMSLVRLGHKKEALKFL